MKSNTTQLVLATAYAINPYKGSEDGMGWNFVLQAAKHQQIIAITRKNNRAHIEKYQAEHPEFESQYKNLRFDYYDLPYWMRFWKKGPLLSMIYFYLWQIGIVFFIKARKYQPDIVHNINFHNNWTPSFLWLLKKPFVWGPVGNHPKIPRSFILKYGLGAYGKDRFLWLLKNFFWHLDPFLLISAKKASKILCMNSEAGIPLKTGRSKMLIVPSVASEIPDSFSRSVSSFQVLSAGRFVPLKGFDLTIRAFGVFIKSIPLSQRNQARLILIGSGPEKKRLEEMIREHQLEEYTRIIEWIEREELKKIYQQSSVFLFPSHEGAGMVVVEAMSYGIPVVCLNNSGPGEFTHPASVLKVNYGKYEAVVNELAEKLELLFSNQSLYNQESLLAKKQFEQSFTWAVRGEQLKNIYQEIAAPEKRPRSELITTPV